MSWTKALTSFILKEHKLSINDYLLKLRQLLANGYNSLARALSKIDPVDELLFTVTTFMCVFMISSSHVMCGKEG